MTGNNAIEDALLPAIEAGELAGAAALVWRNGAVRHIAIAAAGRPHILKR